jgi:hypothetical protein
VHVGFALSIIDRVEAEKTLQDLRELSSEWDKLISSYLSTLNSQLITAVGFPSVNPTSELSTLNY